MMTSVEDIAKQCWQKGSKAVNNEDFDYASDMFHKSAVLVPDNLAYRESLRAAEFRKYKNNKKGAGMMSMPKLLGLKKKLSTARSKKEWDEVDKIAEEGLMINPWDAHLNAAVGEACKERGYYHVAIFAYQIAVGPDGDPENIKLLKDFAYVLQEDEKYHEASVIWSRVQKIDPNDTEARQNANANAFEQTIKQGRYDEATSTQDVMNDREIAERLGLNEKKKKELDAPGKDPILDLKHAIRKDPDNIELFLKMAGVYESQEELELAKETYQTALEMSKGDRNIQELIEDIDLKLMSQELEVLKMKSFKAPDDEKLSKAVVRFARKLLDREIEVFAERVLRYPQNKRLKYELARRYRKLQRWSEAIPLYQQAGTDPRLEIDSFVSLGKCFLQDNKPQLALKQFEKICPKIHFEDKSDTFKEIHYLLGRLYQQFNDFKKAEDHYGEVLAVDYDYRDVRDRLQAMGQ